MMNGNDGQEQQHGSVRIRYGYETYSNAMPEQTTIFGKNNVTMGEEDVSAENADLSMNENDVSPLAELKESYFGTAATDRTENTSATYEKHFAKGALLEKRINEWKEEKQYLADQITINDIAERLGTDRRSLSRFINERYGINFSRWISEMRIEEAKRLMEAKSEVSLEWVALQTGFSSLSYFSKVFSQVVGVSPKKWRALQQ